MKRAGLAVLLSLFLLPFVPGTTRASDIKEADYPIQYEVTAATKDSKLAVEKQCTMTLQDKAKPDIAINVYKKGIGSCQLLDQGKIYRGRPNARKNEIEIVIPVGDTKARIDTWQIVGTVDLKPKSDRPQS